MCSGSECFPKRASLPWQDQIQILWQEFSSDKMGTRSSVLGLHTECCCHRVWSQSSSASGSENPPCHSPRWSDRGTHRLLTLLTKTLDIIGTNTRHLPSLLMSATIPHTSVMFSLLQDDWCTVVIVDCRAALTGVLHLINLNCWLSVGGVTAVGGGHLDTPQAQVGNS